MKAVVQRVSTASVTIDAETVSRIENGIVVLLGVSEKDTEKDAGWLAEKIINLRIFEDDSGKLNISLKETGGQLMVVSQFTLLGDCRKGRRPSFIKAAAPEKANELYAAFVDKTRQSGIKTVTGVFQAMMDVALVNHGPVTLLLDTEDR